MRKAYAYNHRYKRKEEDGQGLEEAPFRPWGDFLRRGVELHAGEEGASDSRETGMAAWPPPTTEPLPSTTATVTPLVGHDAEQVLAQQDQVMIQQDRQLDNISDSLGTLRNIGHQIRDELQYQVGAHSLATHTHTGGAAAGSCHPSPIPPRIVCLTTSNRASTGRRGSCLPHKFA